MLGTVTPKPRAKVWVHAGLTSSPLSQTGPHSVALAVPKLTLYTRLAPDSPSYACLCLLSAESLVLV